MAPKLSPLDRVIRKLDLLDGRRNGYYLDIPLHIENTTGVCEMAQVVAEERSDVTFVPVIENGRGEMVQINCPELVRKLDLLSKIAAKMPMTRILNAAPPKRRPHPAYTSENIGEMFIGYHIVDDMIRALLYATRAIDHPLSAHFEQINFKDHSQIVRDVGKNLDNTVLKSFAVQGVQHGYEIFLKLGKKYKFDATPFQKPPLKPAPTLPPPPQHLSGPTENA